jgi:ATP-dependent phosphofructokinase / diphosphate-dependent phosphofructokinase
MKIAVLTGGGDCPGLNAVIRAVVRRGEQHGLEVMGVREGWRGLMDPPLHERLTRELTSGILHLGGTILATSRTNPFKKPGGPETVLKNIRDLNVGAVVAIGGEDTLGVATKLHSMGVNVVGVPKTIDNDLSGTDLTFGFDTAVQIATDAIDRLHSTAESHNRVIVCEVMGRHAGWIATYSGMAGGADVILIPEKPIDIEKVCEHILRRHKMREVRFSIVVVAEGAKLGGGETKVTEKLDEFGHIRLGGIGQQLAELIEEKTGFETRSTVLGHIQRGGTPTAFDRVLATRFGVHAADMVAKGEWGKMAALRGNAIVSVPLQEATARLKTVDDPFFSVAEVFFG